MKKANGKNYFKAVKMEIKEHKSSFIIFTILRASIVLLMIHQIVTGGYENLYLYLLTILLLYLPSFIQVQFKIEIPPVLEIIIFCFIYAAEILGSIHSFYAIIPFWDTMLHTINGFLAAAIGFSLVWIINDREKNNINLSPMYLVLFAFCFSMTIGVVWEFMEYGMDMLFYTDHQRDTVVQVISSRMLDPEVFGVDKTIKDIQQVVINGKSLGLNGYLDIGLIDTMEDLFVNLIGASVFSVFGYFYARYHKNKAIENFIPRRKNNNEDYLDSDNRV